MRWLDLVGLDLVLEDVESALRSNDLDFERSEEYGDPTIRFDEDGWHYSIDFDPMSRRVKARGAYRTQPLDDAERLVAAMTSDARPTTCGVRELGSSGTVSWRGPDRIVVLTVSPGEPSVHLRCDMEERAADESGVALASYASRLAELGDTIATAPSASGARGTAVERLRAHLSSRLAAHASLVEIAKRATPDTPIVERSLASLEEHAQLLAGHPTLLGGEDDWRDALAICARNEVPYGDPADFGWTMELAGEGITGPLDHELAIVRLVEGPFAFGISRRLQPSHTMFAIDERWPLHDVRLQQLAKIPKHSAPPWLQGRDAVWLRQLGAWLATSGTTQVVLRSVNGDVERIARLLVCARARAS